MSQSRAVRVIRDSGYLMTGQLAMGAVGLVTSAWLARNLIPAELAIFPAALTLEAIAYAFTGLGMYDGFVRKATPLISTGETREAGALMKTGLLLTAIASLLFCVGIYMWREDLNRLILDGTASSVAMQLLALVVLPRLILRHIWGAMNAAQEYRWLAIARTIEHVLRAVGSVVFYILWGITGSLAALAGGSIVGVIVTLIVLRPLLRGEGSWAGAWYTLSVGWPYYAAALCSNLRSRVDYLIVGALGGASPLATYFVAEKIYEYLGHLSRNVMDTTQTKIAEQASEGPAALTRSFRRCTRYFFLGLVPLYFACAGLSSVIIDLYAGGNYPDAGMVLAVLCAAGLLGWFADVHRRFILVVGERWHPVALAASHLVGSALFITVFMILFGPVGAAIGMMLAAIPLLVISLPLLSQTLRPIYDLGALWIGLVGGATIFVLTQATIMLPSTVGAVAAGLAIVPLYYYLFVKGRLAPDDLDLVFGLLPDAIRKNDRILKMEVFFREHLLTGDGVDVAVR